MGEGLSGVKIIRVGLKMLLIQTGRWRLILGDQQTLMLLRVRWGQSCKLL